MIDFKNLLTFGFIFFISQTVLANMELSFQPINGNIAIKSNGFNDFNKQFIKDINSGLSVKIIQIIRFNDRNKTVNLHQNVFSIRYDLWDETFLFKEAQNTIQKIKNLEQLIALLKNKTTINLLFSKKEASLDRDFFFETIYVINPITKEKSGIIKKWMAEKFVGPSSQEVGSETNSFIAGMVNSLVQTELDKNIYGADKQIVFKSKKINYRTLEAL